MVINLGNTAQLPADSPEDLVGPTGLIETLSSKIAALQLPDGSFASLEFDDSTGQSTRLSDVFATALVTWLFSYSEIHLWEHAWVNKALDYLEHQRDSSGLWGFRGRAGEFPPDLDDTSVVLLALIRFGRLNPSEARLIVTSFTLQDSGLLSTWATGARDRSTVVDVTANGHAVLALFEAGLRNANLEAAFLKASEAPWSALKSPYYCTSLPCRLARALFLDCTTRSVRPLRKACAALAPILNSLASEAEIATGSEKTPLYRRRRVPVFYTSNAVLLAYGLHVTSLQTTGKQP